MSGVFKSREKITGLTDYLSGTKDLSHGLCETNVENLFVIQSGADVYKRQIYWHSVATKNSC